MDIEREIQVIALAIQQGKTDYVKGTKEILSLFSEQDVEDWLNKKG